MSALRPYIEPPAATVPVMSVPGGDPSTWLNLALNENLYGASPQVAPAIAARSPRANCYAAPGAPVLRAALAKAHGFDPDQLILGNGSEDVIDNLIRAFVRADDEIIVAANAWAGFAMSAARQGGKLVSIPNKADFLPDIDATLAAVGPRTRIVFIVNPHNPLGSCPPPADVERVVKTLPPHIVCCIDSAYAEYCDEPGYKIGHEYVEGRENVFVTRTFSKAYGLAGARVGWGHGSKPLVAALNATRQLSVVPQLSEAAALAGLADAAHIKDCVERNARVRAKFTAVLRELGLYVVPSRTNFIAAQFPNTPGRTAADVAKALLADGIIVSQLGGYGLPDYLRFTMPRDSDLDRLVGSLHRAYGRNVA